LFETRSTGGGTESGSIVSKLQGTSTN